MISNSQFGGQPNITANKQAMPENPKYDGPAGLDTSGSDNKFAANNSQPLAKPGFSS
jgi:hypothetical protein